MAISVTRVTVGTSAVALAAPSTVTRTYGSGVSTDDVPTAVVIRNASDASVYIGSSDSVTTGNGFELVSLASISVQLAPSDRLFAIAGSADKVVHILKQS